MLSRGRIEEIGPPREVCEHFYAHNDEKIRAAIKHSTSSLTASGELELANIAFIDINGNRTDEVIYDQNVELQFTINLSADLENITFGFGFHTTDFLYLTTHNSEDQLSISHLQKGTHAIRCLVRRLPLLPGVYGLRFGVTTGQLARTVFYAENIIHFQVKGEVPITSRDGFFTLDANWSIYSKPYIGSSDAIENASSISMP
jgi:hypothetical protein